MHLEPRQVPEQHALATDRRARVLAALEELPSGQKAALVLVDMEGWPVAEAAEVLQVPPGTVKSRCARGRARLASLLPDLRQGTAGAGAASDQGEGGEQA